MIVISKTKYEASEAEIRKLFSFHKMGNVVDIAALGCGEFNAVYKVTCDNGANYTLKIAPPEGSKVLTYEKNMMKSEVFWYSQMHEKTDILCPAVSYLALIEEVEKYVRYEADNPTYIRNSVDAREMYDMAFGIL